jgi:hypothetical protein
MLSRGQHAGGQLVVRGYRAAIEWRGRSSASGTASTSRPATPSSGFRKRVGSNASDVSVSDNGSTAAEKTSTAEKRASTPSAATATTASKIAALLRTPKKDAAPATEDVDKGDNTTTEAMRADRQNGDKPAAELAECGLSLALALHS